MESNFSKDKSFLTQQIKSKQSFLAIGLDSDITRIPKHILETKKNPISYFNKSIIDATQDLCISYKMNIAFYESQGIDGWKALEETLKHIPEELFTIADAKRGDIGNTSKQYAETFFKTYPCDSITLAPYMGSDSIGPFLEYENKWSILLALTSNQGAFDFQLIKDQDGKELYKHILSTSSKWGSTSQLMYVVGATKPEFFQSIREIIPEHFLLVPGIGAQGGSLEEVCKYGLTKDVGLIVNSSRGIIFASDGLDFAEAARASALSVQQRMVEILSTSGI